MTDNLDLLINKANSIVGRDLSMISLTAQSNVFVKKLLNIYKAT